MFMVATRLSRATLLISMKVSKLPNLLAQQPL